MVSLTHLSLGLAHRPCLVSSPSGPRASRGHTWWPPQAQSPLAWLPMSPGVPLIHTQKVRSSLQPNRPQGDTEEAGT